MELPGGLFAAASCLDADLDQAADWMNTHAELAKWAAESDAFQAYQNGDGKKERTSCWIQQQ